MYKLELHPDVFEELDFAKKWYADKSVELANEFINEIEFAMNAIKTNPEMWPPFLIVPRIRHFLVHRFPFGIYYIVKNEMIQILAVGHLHRKPGYWKSRI